MNLTNFRFEIDADGIALATWDMPGRSMNVITPEVMDELSRSSTTVAARRGRSRAASSPPARRRSPAAPTSRCCRASARVYEALAAREGRGGGDAAPSSRSRASSRCSTGASRPAASRSPRRSTASASAAPSSSRSPATTASSSDDDTTRVGLPEIKVGLFPGAGGTQRVARLMQTGDALQMLFKGEQIRAAAWRATWASCTRSRRATRSSQTAKDWIKAGGSAVAPWDQKGFKLPSDKVYSPAGMQIWPPANAIYRRETHDNYPAAKAILAGRLRGPAAADGPRAEGRVALLRQDPALEGGGGDDPHAVRLDAGAQQGRAPADRTCRPTELKKVGVVGAGFMGAGIAYVTAHAGLEVVLVDRDLEAAEKGKAYSHKLMTDQIMKGRAKTADRDALLARITPSADYADLDGLRPRRRGGVRGPEGQGRGDRARSRRRSARTASSRSNTSTLPISGLAEDLEAAGAVHRHPLLLAGREDDAGRDHHGQGDRRQGARRRRSTIVRAIKKTPIVVNDCRGFFANRCVGGLHPRRPPDADRGRAAGDDRERRQAWPACRSARCRSTTRSAIDLGLEDRQGDEGAGRAEARRSRRRRSSSSRMVERQGRLGRKNGKGFYDYPEKRPEAPLAGPRATCSRRSSIPMRSTSRS